MLAVEPSTNFSIRACSYTWRTRDVITLCWWSLLPVIHKKKNINSVLQSICCTRYADSSKVTIMAANVTSAQSVYSVVHNHFKELLLSLPLENDVQSVFFVRASAFVKFEIYTIKEDRLVSTRSSIRARTWRCRNE